MLARWLRSAPIGAGPFVAGIAEGVVLGVVVEGVVVPVGSVAKMV